LKEVSGILSVNVSAVHRLLGVISALPTALSYLPLEGLRKPSRSPIDAKKNRLHRTLRSWSQMSSKLVLPSPIRLKLLQQVRSLVTPIFLQVHRVFDVDSRASDFFCCVDPPLLLRRITIGN
jgi:hypothetical protein